jgi:hypothetical protein
MDTPPKVKTAGGYRSSLRDVQQIRTTEEIQAVRDVSQIQPRRVCA